jgi:mannose-6-phosphate isomerase
MSSEAELVATLEGLRARLESSGSWTNLEQRFLDLYTKYPNDVGLFFVFLLNLVKLEKGQGIYLKPGIPHAYLSGNIVECMATSDNVVRVGLTPKYKDGDTLIDILDYDYSPATILEGIGQKGRIVYQTPVDEFRVSSCSISPGQTVGRAGEGGPEVILVVEGQISVSWNSDVNWQSENYHRGQTILIPANLQYFEMTSENGAEIFSVIVP